MNRFFRTLILMLLCSLSFALGAEEVLPLLLEKISALQQRADKLAFGEPGANNYHLAKARIWLDMATSEYHQTDTSGALLAAITQAETILTALENKQTDISTDMPADFPGSEKVRPDLWEKIASIKNKGDYVCGQRQIAESEVQLIWAGHEKVESGWSHAEAYARIAESSITEAQVAINICNGAAPSVSSNTVVIPVAPGPAPVSAAIPVHDVTTHVIEKITLSADALFNFNKASLTRYSRARLNKLAHDIKKIKSLEEIILVGHTDRLRSDGKHKRNQTLSEKRAKTIKQYLIGKGVPADKITARGVGSKEPLVQCSGKPRKSKQIVCLQPNRRVEITIRGVQ
jgi:outer membrane protein OmpA-like peptidoglycan-associated protein